MDRASHPLRRLRHCVRGAGVLGLFLLARPAVSQQPPESAASQQAAAAAPDGDGAAAEALSPEQLQSLVAPIALYPDALLAQILVAATYPLEIVQLSQWMQRHPDLADQALADSVAAQPWDASIQSMAAVPDAVNRLAEDIQWTTELGNAFLAQQSDVMEAVQVMRGKAREQGALESNEQQTVETQVVERETVIVIESTNPQVVYVPAYNPVYVYPPPLYPYPPIYYPPYYPGGAFISFSIGFTMGAAMWGGPCCYAGWGGNNIYINNNNHFNNINIDRGDRTQINAGGGRGDSWQHNPSHRGGAPYGDRATADRFGGSPRPSSAVQGGRGQLGGGAGAGNLAPGGAAGGRGGAGAGNRGGGTAAGALGGASAGGRVGATDRSAGGAAAGRQSIGNRSVPSSTSRSGGFSGGSRGYSGSSARASSSRGGSSFGGSRAGAGMRGGGRRR